MRHGLPFLIALAVTLGGGCIPSDPSGGARAEAPLPSTPVVTLDGTATDLRAVLRGRVAVVSFWATWCDACVGEIDALKRLQAQAAARRDAVVVGVAVGETRETVAAFARERGLPYAQLVDTDFRLADALGESRVPATLVVDRRGRIVFRGGALDPAGLAAFRSALGTAP
jgi:cytochrome c biogenesis protein CcmG, thiol:disulfide interchange protein DsbE